MTRRQPHPDAPGLDDARRRPGRVRRATTCSAGRLVAGRRDGRPAVRRRRPSCGPARCAAGCARPSFRLVRDGTTLSTADTCRAGRHRAPHDRRRHPAQPGARAARRRAPRWCSRACSSATRTSAALANNLALDLGHAVQINAYLSPAAAKGLELHFDFHDVFVLQLDGRKRWRVWEPLDRTRQPVRTGPRMPMPTFDELGEPALDLTLAAGDCLYLPAGLPARRRDRRVGVVAPDDRRHGPGVAPGRPPRRRRGRRRAARCARRSRPASADRPTWPRLAAAPRPAAPCGGGWPRRCGGASRRPGCGRCTPPTIDARRRRSTVTPGSAAVAGRDRRPRRARARRPVADDAGRGRRAARRRAARPPGRSRSPTLDGALDDASRLRRRPAARRRGGGRPCRLTPGRPLFECAVAARERGEPVTATASQVAAVAARRGQRTVGPRRHRPQRARAARPAVWRQAMKRQGIRVHRRPPRPGAPPASTAATGLRLVHVARAAARRRATPWPHGV